MSGLPVTFPGLGFLDLSPFTGGGEAFQRIIDPDGYELIAQVTVEEDHEDDLTITEHPVEQGAAISDHAYKRPAELRLRIGWSQGGGLPAIGAPDPIFDVSTIYEQILTLQSERRPFSVYTAKRPYQNMLVANLKVHTDAKTEWTLLCDVVFRQILLVNTQTVSSATSGGSASINGSPGMLANPQGNTPSTTMGQTQTMPASLSDSQIVAAGGTLAA